MKFNFNFYRHLLGYRTFSYDDISQDMFIDFLQSELEMYGFQCRRDKYGNLIADRGPIDQIKPLIIAHVDINQREEQIPTIHNIDGWIIGMLDGQQIGAGHDDRAGIYFALLYAEHTTFDVRIIFTKDEEVGCLGTSALPKWSLKNISMAVQLDRRGRSDISDFTNGVNVVSKSFKKRAIPTLEKYGYQWQRTMFTDVGHLKSHHMVDFCCMNISCGYYDEHTNNERLNVAQYQNAINFATELLITFGYEKQHHKAESKKEFKSWNTPKWQSIGSTNGSKKSDRYDSVWYSDFNDDKKDIDLWNESFNYDRSKKYF